MTSFRVEAERILNSRVTGMLTKDQALFSFRFLIKFSRERGNEKRALYKSSLKRLQPPFFDCFTFTETANQNFFRSTILKSSRMFYGCERAVGGSH